MKTSKGTLTRWRKDALKGLERIDSYYNNANAEEKKSLHLAERSYRRILTLTRELLDIRLMEEK